MTKISVVMSAYNAENTISRAIKSLLNQTYRNIEIIIVNDCSTDDTENIVLQYCNTDSRIKYLKNDKNLGAGLTRRKGIENISGEYMSFLDSDDYLDNDYYEVLLNYAIKNDVDIVSPGFIMTDENLNVIENRIPSRSIIQTGMNKFSPNKEDTKRFMNPMLIKSKLWDNVVYSERRFIEDTPTLVQILYWAKSIMLVDCAGYYYVQNPSSLIHSASNIKYLIFQALCIKDIALFFKSVGLLQSTNNLQFKNVYNEVKKLCTNIDKAKYSNELYELKQYYKQIN